MRILIVDDHALVRRGMSYVVKEGFPDADVVEAESSAAALEFLHTGARRSTSRWSTCACPTSTAWSCSGRSRPNGREMPVIMLSTYENAPYVKRALSDGAAGYLLKDATPEDLSQAINVAMSGSGNVLSPRVIQNLFEDQQVGRRPPQRATQRVQPDPARERHPGVAVGGSLQPRHRGCAVPEREDREGPPGGDLPQARGHEPDAGRDDGRADGCRTHPRRPGDGRVGRRASSSLAKSL